MRHTTDHDHDTGHDLGFDLAVTGVTPRPAGGTWVRGRVASHRFEALVFAEHADRAEWELGDSRISKLWVERLGEGGTVFHWDRGLDVPPADDAVQALIDFLCAGLADLAYPR